MTYSPLTPCGSFHFPMGNRYSPTNGGGRVRIIGIDNYYDNSMLHNIDIFLHSKQKFITVIPRIRQNDPIYPQSVLVYVNRSNYSDIIKNSIQIIVRVKETKQVIANHVFGTINSEINPYLNSTSLEYKAIILDCNVSNKIDLNNKTLQIEFYSLCENFNTSCCDRLPTTFTLSNIINIIQCSNTTPPPTTTTTTTTTTSTTRTTTTTTGTTRTTFTTSTSTTGTSTTTTTVTTSTSTTTTTTTTTTASNLYTSCEAVCGTNCGGCSPYCIRLDFTGTQVFLSGGACAVFDQNTGLLISGCPNCTDYNYCDSSTYNINGTPTVCNCCI